MCDNKQLFVEIYENVLNFNLTVHYNIYVILLINYILFNY